VYTNSPAGANKKTDRAAVGRPWRAQLKGEQELATKIRLKRTGSKKQPYYRVVVADSRDQRDGRAIEEIGYYGPTETPVLLNIKQDRALYWLLEGAQPSDTARSLMSKVGIMTAFAEAQKARKQAHAASQAS